MEETVDDDVDESGNTATSVEVKSSFFIEAIPLLNNEKSEENPVDKSEVRPDCIFLKNYYYLKS